MGQIGTSGGGPAERETCSELRESFIITTTYTDSLFLAFCSVTNTTSVLQLLRSSFSFPSVYLRQLGALNPELPLHDGTVEKLPPGFFHCSSLRNPPQRQQIASSSSFCLLLKAAISSRQPTRSSPRKIVEPQSPSSSRYTFRPSPSPPTPLQVNPLPPPPSLAFTSPPLPQPRIHRITRTRTPRISMIRQIDNRGFPPSKQTTQEILPRPQVRPKDGSQAETPPDGYIGPSGRRVL